MIIELEIRTNGSEKFKYVQLHDSSFSVHWDIWRSTQDYMLTSMTDCLEQSDFESSLRESKSKSKYHYIGKIVGQHHAKHLNQRGRVGSGATL